MDDFIIRALIAGFGLVLLACPLGCFVIWKRMAYFGDSLAHSSLLGIAFGLVIGVSTNIGIIITASFFALILLWLEQKEIFATDTLLGILAHSSLSFGMIALSLINTQNFDLHSYLFGDILTVAKTDIYWIMGAVCFVLIFLIKYWEALVLLSLNKDLAKAEGMSTFFLRFVFIVLITVVVASSIKIIGLLLITSMLIIPAATARHFSKSPEAMALIAIVIGLFAVIGGTMFSYYYDSPTGPSIVAASSLLFILLLPFSFMKKSRF